MTGGRARPEELVPAADVEVCRRVLDEAHASLVDYVELLATTIGGLTERGPGHLAFAGAHEYAGTYTNGVVRTDLDGDPVTTPAELLAHADAFFGPMRRSYVVWVRVAADGDLEAELRRRGFEPRPPAQGSPAILVERERLVMTESPGAEVSETRDEDDYVEYLRLVGSVYGMPDADLALVEGVLFSRASLRDERSHVYLARDRETGTLCGGTATFLSGPACHAVWNVADPAFRGRGIGPALLTYSARAAFDLGAEFLWGVASQQGAPVWNRVGIRTVTHYQRYVAPVAYAGAMAAVPRSGVRGRRGAARPV